VSVAGEIKPSAARSPRPRASAWIRSNIVGGVALIVREPRLPPHGRPVAWWSPRRLLIATLLAVTAIAACMVLLDAPTMVAATRIPLRVVNIFNELTDYGRSGWILAPTAVILALIAGLASPALSRASRLALTALAVRFSFVFFAVALPGLVVTVVKRLIGRGRPFVGGHIDPFLYRPFGWAPAYASLPSGHATNVFAALVAIGLVWPRLRIVVGLYALVIAASRVVVLAHHPSDVLAGAMAGAFGALLVRDWFAARRLGFAIGADGVVRTWPGPSWGRVWRMARQQRMSRKSGHRFSEQGHAPKQ
jgi:membrane-associated phospholipid phosphatase